MQNSKVIRKVSLAVFKDKKMIMVRAAKNPEAFYTLGGKIENDESELACLKREVMEEVAVEIDENSLKFLHEFEAPAYGHENTIVNIKLYQGELKGEPAPSAEIVEVKYFDTSVDKRHLTPITFEMFDWLKANGYIR